MNQSLHIRLPTAEKTRFAGFSLADSLYALPVTIFLTGDLGAGKTTFLQGFAEKMGITDPLTSPTYALEQQYKTRDGIPFLHLDLYRLNERDAAELVDTTDDHPGIRCIEWADRLPERMPDKQSIHIHLQEFGKGRELTITFDDCRLPTQKQIDDWRAEVMLPAHITSHCNAVARVAVACADQLIASGHIIRKDALDAAAKLHDLFRFIDFRAAPPPGVVQTKEEDTTWAEWKKRYPGMRHEDACTAFLIEQGYPTLGKIVETHGLRIPEKAAETIEQKLLFYADKRVIIDRVVSIQERFDDFLMRYANGKQTEQNTVWLNFTLQLEKDLFPDGTPL